MGKVEAYKEIVRMRKLVRRAKVCVVHKLTREAKTLRTKKGTEKQQEKYKKKADKLIGEIYALKMIKDDRITKFALLNKRTLQEILQTKKSRRHTRIMARVAHHKTLNNAIVKFRETYPQYEEYLLPGKEKSMNEESRFQEAQNEGIGTRTDTRKSQNRVFQSSVMEELHFDQNVDEDIDNEDIESKDSEESEAESNEVQRNPEPETILRIKPPSPVKKEVKSSERTKRSRKESVESIPEHDVPSDDAEKARTDEVPEEKKEQPTVKVISKQATVRRFAELLQEQDSKENDSSSGKNEAKGKNKPEAEKQVDSFFVSRDGDAYLSVAPTTMTENDRSLEDENGSFYDNKPRRFGNKRSFPNERFFSNVRTTDGPRGKQDSRRNNNNSSKDSFRDKASSFKKRNNATAPSFENKSENLHPSWAAKKKQQEIIKQGFQGKKIVFGDD